MRKLCNHGEWKRSWRIQHFEVDCGEETNQACWGDEDDHTEGHWYIDSNPEYVPDDEQEYQAVEPEPEPLDQYSTCYGPKSQLTDGQNYSSVYEESSDGEPYVQPCAMRRKPPWLHQ